MPIPRSLFARVPQRLLLSGAVTEDELVALVGHLQNKHGATKDALLLTGDVLWSSSNHSFKIDWSDTAKRDGQTQYENARGVVEWIHTHPTPGNKRIFVLENADRLTVPAANALLKVVEEPPSEAYFIFTTANHWQLLTTIRSRMQVVTLSEAHTAPLSDWAQGCIDATSLLDRFLWVDALAAHVKKSGDKSLYTTVAEELMGYARRTPSWHGALLDLFSLYADLNANTNPRFTYEATLLGLHKK